MLEYDRKDISKGVDINKANASKECDVSHYWYFLDKNFNYEPYLCNGCHDLMQKAINFNDVAIVLYYRECLENPFLVYEQRLCHKHNE